jgi:DNA polymerase III delta subunit
MDLSTVKAQIKSKQLDKFYIFTGEEIKVMDIYIQQIAKVFNAKVSRADSLADIYGNMKNRSFIQMRQVYVIRDDKDFLSNEKLQADIEQRNASESIIIFVYTAIDKRTSFAKKYSDKIVTFDLLKEDTLAKYISKDINLNEKNTQLLIEVGEHNYNQILLEIDKIKQYRDNNEYTNDDDTAFTVLLKSGVIHQPARDAIFDFVDAVLRDKKKLAFDLLEQSYTVGEANVVLLSVLYTNTKQVLQVQSYNGNGKITDATGLTPWQVKCAKDKANYYSNGDLVYLMRLIRRVEKGIKIGEIEDAMSMYYVLVNFW